VPRPSGLCAKEKRKTRTRERLDREVASAGSGLELTLIRLASPHWAASACRGPRACEDRCEDKCDLFTYTERERARDSSLAG